MTTVQQVYEVMQRLAPPELAEHWDNPGLLVDCGGAGRRGGWGRAGGDTGTGFCVSIKIVAYDHTNLLIELATIIGDANVPIKTVNTELDEKNRIATFRFVLEVKSREQMDKLVKLLQRKTDVIDVFRVQG